MLSSGAFSFGEKMEFGRLMSRLPKIGPEQWLGTSVKDWVVEHVRHERIRHYV